MDMHMNGCLVFHYENKTSKIPNEISCWWHFVGAVFCLEYTSCISIALISIYIVAFFISNFV